MLKNYFKIALKVLLRRKFFTFISLFAISFTLIVLMVAAAFMDHILAPMAPETKLNRTLCIFFAEMSGPDFVWNGTPGYGLLDRYARNLPNVERTAFFTEGKTAVSYLRGQKIESSLKRTDGEYWQILQFEFVEGGPITAEDEKNANFVAVINQATKEKFFGAENAVGKSIEVDSQNFRVVGVVRNVPVIRYIPFSDIWVPISTTKTTIYKKELMGDFSAILLAKNRSDFPAIKEELASRMTHVEFPDLKEYNKMVAFADTYPETLSRDALNARTADAHPERLIAILSALALLFMLLPTMNLININVSRILERASEIGVRKAFGASSWNLVGQFVVENLVLTLLGGIIAFFGSLAVLRMITQSGLIQYAEFHLSYRMFLYGLSLSVFFGIFSGVYPAWRMSRLNPVEALRGGSR